MGRKAKGSVHKEVTRDGKTYFVAATSMAYGKRFKLRANTEDEARDLLNQMTARLEQEIEAGATKAVIASSHISAWDLLSKKAPLFLTSQPVDTPSPDTATQTKLSRPTRKSRCAYVLQYWLENFVKGILAYNTYTTYDLNTRRAAPYIGNLRMDEIQVFDIQECYKALMERGNGLRPLSNRSIDQVHETLHVAFEWAVGAGIMDINPVRSAKPPKTEKREINQLNDEQLRRLLSATRDDWFFALWSLAATTGPRLGEILGLRWADFDLNKGTVTIKRSLTRVIGDGLVVQPTKNSRYRTIILSEGVTQALREYRDLQAAERKRLGSAWGSSRYAFTDRNGRQLTEWAIRWELRQAIEKAGLTEEVQLFEGNGKVIKDFRIHDLRHTAATLALLHGDHPKLVQEMLGHSSIAITIDTYSHYIQSLHGVVAANMQKYIFDNLESE
jgi:integrase